jgi:hypothetical protein
MIASVAKHAAQAGTTSVSRVAKGTQTDELLNEEPGAGLRLTVVDCLDHGTWRPFNKAFEMHDTLEGAAH